MQVKTLASAAKVFFAHNTSRARYKNGGRVKYLLCYTSKYATLFRAIHKNVSIEQDKDLNSRSKTFLGGEGGEEGKEKSAKVP